MSMYTDMLSILDKCLSDKCIIIFVAQYFQSVLFSSVLVEFGQVLEGEEHDLPRTKTVL